MSGRDVAPVATIDLSDTPVVIIDLDILQANILRMQQFLSRHGIACRPHIKTHKSPAIARMQMNAGAAGITCQKLGEVSVMLDAGITDIFLTYNVVGEAKLTRLRQEAARGRISVVCDSLEVARGLSQVFRGSTELLPVLVECDVGAGRNGVQTPYDVALLAEQIERLPGVIFAGLMTYPITGMTGEFLTAAYVEIERAGLGCSKVSTGGTVAHRLAPSVPGITEHRPGVYVFNDCTTVEGGAANWEDCSMRVYSTVVSRPTTDRAIIDAGSKTLTSDRFPAGPLKGTAEAHHSYDPAGAGFGRVVEYPEAVVFRLDEEHGYVDISTCPRRPEVGEVVSIIPNHACAVTNLHDQLFGVRCGQVETVFPVVARGMVR